MSGAYWLAFAERWRRTAFICRYAHQDVYRVLGRDPVESPLTDLEREIFYRTTLEHVEAEFKPRAARTLLTGHPGNE